MAINSLHLLWDLSLYFFCGCISFFAIRFHVYLLLSLSVSMNGPKRVLAYYYYLVFFSFSFCHIDPYESRIFTFIPLKGCVCKKGKNIVWLERDRTGVRFNGHWIPRNSASLVGPFCRQVHERHCFEVMENYFLFPFMLITCTMSTRTWMKRFREIKGLRCKSPLIEKNSKKK